MSGQPEITPVFIHLGVQEVLVDGRKLGLQGLSQMFDDLIVSTHKSDSSAKPAVH